MITQHRPVLTALLSQIAAGAVCFGLAAVLKRAGGPVPDLTLLLAGQGVVAGVLGARWGLARWWWPLNLLAPLAAGAALMLALPSWVYPMAFVALAVVFWNASSDRVPLYLSNRKTWRAIGDLLPGTEGGQCLDLGSGIGGLTIHLAARRPEMRFRGIESAPLPFALSWLRLKAARRANAGFVYGNFWTHDLGGYDVVYAFLSPAPMTRLYEKVRAEMKPGSLFISNSFTVPDIDPDDIIEVDDRRRTKLLVWRV